MSGGAAFVGADGASAGGAIAAGNFDTEADGSVSIVDDGDSGEGAAMVADVAALLLVERPAISISRARASVNMARFEAGCRAARQSEKSG